MTITLDRSPAAHPDLPLSSPRPAPARVLGQAHAVPAAMDQAQIWQDHFSEFFGHHPIAGKIWARSGIQTRHAVINPTRHDLSQWSTGARMERYVEEALPLGRRAIQDALDRSGVAADEIGLLSVVSCTGYATPGLDILLSEQLGMAPDVQRLMVGHMGCYAAVPGLGAVSDFVVARRRPAVLLCLELTSLHPQPASPTLLAGTPTEKDLEQVVAHALFADAAAAIVVGSDDATPGVRGDVAAGFEVIDIAAVTDWSTKDLMSWDVTDLGFRMGLSAQVPDMLARSVRGAVEDLLGRHGYRPQDVGGWAVHPGGRRILDVVGAQLDLPEGALDASYGVLRDFGNCSSPTVLLVLERLAATTDIAPGAPVVAMAFGPGLTLYAALLRRPVS